MSALNQLQTQLEKNFRNYTRCLYSSKVKSHFPHMLTPTFQGCYIKISDCYLEDDSNYIDLEQQVQGVQLTFAAKSEYFSLQDHIFSFWLHSDYISIEQLINIFRKLNKSDKFSLAIELADGLVTQKTVDISYGYDYDYVPTL